MGRERTANGAITDFEREGFLSTVANFPISGDENPTMTAWIKLVGTTPQTSVVGRGINSPSQKWIFDYQGASVRTEINSKRSSKGNLTIDTWYHIATVWDKK